MRGAGVPIVVGAACTLPPDWVAWCSSRVRGEPIGVPAELHTRTEGWAVTFVETRIEGAWRIHAFYAVLDRALHATAELPAAAPEDARARIRHALLTAAPVFEPAIVALAEL